MIIVCLLLVNMLIATMADTYAVINETKNESIRQVRFKKKKNLKLIFLIQTLNFSGPKWCLILNNLLVLRKE